MKILTWLEKRVDPFKPAHSIKPPEKLLAFYKHYLVQVWPILLVLLITGFFTAIIEVSIYAFLGKLIDLMKETRNPVDFFKDHGTLLAWMVFVVLVARPVFRILDSVIGELVLAANFQMLVRWQNYRHVQRQSLSFFNNDFAGRLANRIMVTGPSLRESAMQVVDALWYVTIYTVGAFVLFVQNDVRLVVPLILWIAGYVWLLVYFIPRIRDSSAIMSEARSVLLGRIVDSYTNIMAVKLFANSDSEDGFIKEALKDHNGKLLVQLRYMVALTCCVWLLSSAMIVLTTGLGLWLWSQGNITVGAIALTTGLVIRIVNMSDWIMWVMMGIFYNIGQVQDGIKTVASPLEMTDKPGAVPLQVDRGEITFDRVDFSYEGSSRKILDHLSLVIKPGERVGLVGHSGAGKTTLLNLLLRFYAPTSGRILIDGQDIAGVQQDSLRAHIGMVTQEPALLHRSVRDNILFARKDARERDIIEAARRAQADDFIGDLEDGLGGTGYDSVVGERGVKLSGGQRQRIAIARVLLKDAPVLLLDEATSALDSEVEQAIQEQLFNLMEGKTVIAIAHRLSTIAAMDRLVVMEEGQIVETGTHQELIDKNGLYARLWAHQSGGFVGT